MTHGIRTVGVVGLGTMGAGIAQVVAHHGYPVVACEVSNDLVQAGLARIGAGLGRHVERGRMTAAERETALAHVAGTTDIDAFGGCDLVVEAIGKRPVVCPDRPGFVVNRILIPLLNDCVRLHEQGGISADDLDQAMTAGLNWPIGPLRLIDLIGADVHVHASEALWQAYREPRSARRALPSRRRSESLSVFPARRTPLVTRAARRAARRRRSAGAGA